MQWLGDNVSVPISFPGAGHVVGSLDTVGCLPGQRNVPSMVCQLIVLTAY